MSELHPDHVARKAFSLSFRGFDQHEVRAFLATVAGELHAWEEREHTLRARLADLEQQPKIIDELDEAAIEAALGETATRIIHAAREAAAEVRTRAESIAAEKLDEAEAILARSTAEATEANAARRAETEAALTARREESERKAASIIEDARAKAASLIADASDTRERTLRDLADRRDAIVAEIEQLQAARDRLRAAHDSVRSALDVAVLDVEAAEMRASDILARVSPVDVPASPAPPAIDDDVAGATDTERDDADAEADVEVEVEVVEVPVAAAPIAVEPPTDAADESPTGADEGPAIETPPDERRSSALRLLRSRPEADGTPTSPPADDPYEGVRIIRPEVTPEPVPVGVDVDASPEPASTTADAPTEDEPVEDAPAADAPVGAEPGADAPVEDEPVAEAPAPDVREDEAEAEAEADGAAAAEADAPSGAASDDVEGSSDDGIEDEPPADAPVEDLFARLRAERAATVAKATAVLAVTDPSPSAPADESPAPAPAVDADASPDLAVLAARDDAVADAERAIVRSLKRALADEQNEVLDALRRLKGKPSVDALLPDTAVHEARYDAVLGSGAAAAARAGGELVGGGGDAGAVTAEIGRTLAGDLRGRVARSIDDAAGDVETLAEAISATYREWKTSRAEPLARDVIAAAFASGTYVAASGSLRWVVDPAEGGCPDCEDNALAGGTPKGTAFPTGQVRPPAHAGCRCALVPVS